MNASASFPRRESTKRAAKERKKSENAGKEEEMEEPPEFQDSDSDPAWTPKVKDDGEDDILVKSKKKGQLFPSQCFSIIFIGNLPIGIKYPECLRSNGTYSCQRKKFKRLLTSMNCYCLTLFRFFKIVKIVIR